MTSLAVAGTVLAAKPPPQHAPRIKPIPTEKVIEDGTLIYDVTLVTEKQPGLEKKLAVLSPAMRKLALLSLIWHGWGRDGLHTFFYMGDASMAPEILEALKEPGFRRQRLVFAQAMALFGPIYPRAEYLRDTFFAESKGGDEPSPFDSVFDKKLFALGVKFGSKSEYGAALARFVARDRKLTGFIAKTRAAMRDETRLNWLMEQFWTALGNEFHGEKIRPVIAAWPSSYRIIYLLYEFNLEMLNGSVEQYFYNYAGELAPETVEAMREAGLEKHAQVLQDCIDSFGVPYPADTVARREGFLDPENKGIFKTLRDALFERATAEVDDGAIEDKMIEIAKRENILPH
jgi:hypothetical protein